MTNHKNNKDNTEFSYDSVSLRANYDHYEDVTYKAVLIPLLGRVVLLTYENTRVKTYVDPKYNHIEIELSAEECKIAITLEGHALDLATHLFVNEYELVKKPIPEPEIVVWYTNKEAQRLLSKIDDINE